MKFKKGDKMKKSINKKILNFQKILQTNKIKTNIIKPKKISTQ